MKTRQAKPEKGKKKKKAPTTKSHTVSETPFRNHPKITKTLRATAAASKLKKKSHNALPFTTTTLSRTNSSFPHTRAHALQNPPPRRVPEHSRAHVPTRSPPPSPPQTPAMSITNSTHSSVIPNGNPLERDISQPNSLQKPHHHSHYTNGVATMDSDDEPLIKPASSSTHIHQQSDDDIPLGATKSRLKRTSKRSRSSAHQSTPSKSAKRVKIQRPSPSNSRSNIVPAGPVRKHLKAEKEIRKPKREPKREPKRQPKREQKLETKKEPSLQPNPESASQDTQYKWWDGGDANDPDDSAKVKWNTLQHNAVIFPPPYQSHACKLLYKRQPVNLSIESEEIATFYAAKLATDYVKKPTFQRNFFEDFRNSMKGTPAYKTVKQLQHCDFSQIYDHLERKKAEKKELPAAERKKIREAETAAAKKFTVALVDGREEKVGNFRVEPPGLFLGRGEHPKMGKVKARIYPEDITINIGETEDVPECPVPGHRWGSIVHKKDVTWLCEWKDTITGGSKYVWLAAGSAFKGMSDHAKFEKSRKLSQFIDRIRQDYRNDWKAKAKDIRQRAVAMYLIDKLALRVGNEKGEDEADTVGCCSLRVEHVKFEQPRTVVFDFLGKDSIRYFNSVEVEKPVFDNLKLFCRGKAPGDEIFHRLTVTGLNDYLKSRMDGLSAKVFRTYNASFTLDRLLQDTPANADVNQKVVFYNQQNKEVAILCNHQRALPKAHSTQMEKMDKKVQETVEWLEELKRGRSRAKRISDEKGVVEVTQWMPEKPAYTEGMNDKERAEERKRAAEAPRIETKRKKNLAQLESSIKSVNERLGKLKADMQTKEDLKTVALGTSKINYLDPRITVAWCKKHEVPIEKIFAKTLLVKFAWAMEVSEKFRF